MAATKTKKIPKHLFSTWLRYRLEVRGDNQEALIQQINKNYDRKYTQSTFWRMQHLEVSVPEIVQVEINKDFKSVLIWVMSLEDVLIDGCIINHDALAEYLKVGITTTKK